MPSTLSSGSNTPCSMFFDNRLLPQGSFFPSSQVSSFHIAFTRAKFTKSGPAPIKHSLLHVFVRVKMHYPWVLVNDHVLEAITLKEEVISPPNAFAHGDNVEIVSEEVEVYIAGVSDTEEDLHLIPSYHGSLIPKDATNVQYCTVCRLRYPFSLPSLCSTSSGISTRSFLYL